jgi:predicted enzyme related to lactoylglutathione lyase
MANFLGLYTAIYSVADLDLAKKWYSEALGTAPYFDQPYYVGFNVGGHELGLVPQSPNPTTSVGVSVYWGVSSMKEAWGRLIAQGAEPVEDPNDVGEGILVATVRDPLGNLLGVIENPHFPNRA